jgi:mRNA interferase HigB
MRVVGKKRLLDFCRQHAQARPPAQAWLAEVESAQWQRPQDIKDRFATASFLADNQIIFNLGGNKYRLKVQVEFAVGVVVIKNVATHAEYERWKS